MGANTTKVLTIGNVDATYYKLTIEVGVNKNVLLGKCIAYFEKGLKTNKEIGSLGMTSNFLFYLDELCSLNKQYQKVFMIHKEYIVINTVLAAIGIRFLLKITWKDVKVKEKFSFKYGSHYNSS